MKKQIWKFKLSTTNQIAMPEGSEILTVQTQNDVPCIWAMVNPEAKQELRIFEVIGTGHDITDYAGSSRKYIGTFQLSGGALVYHVFENIKQ